MAPNLLVLLAGITPLYGIVASGFIAGKVLKTERESLANLLMYVISPVVFFGGIVTAPDLHHTLLLLPIFFGIGCTIGTIFYFVSKYFHESSERSLLGFAAGAANTGCFGIPLVLVILGPDALGAAVLATIGLDLFEYSLGYYFLVRHHKSPRDAIKKIVSSPALWGFVAGMIAAICGLHPDASFLNAIAYFKGAYVIIGMMIIGLGLATATRSSFDRKFTTTAFVAKFICFPVVVALLAAADQCIFHMFSPTVHTVMFLLSIVPIASDTVAFATTLNMHPEKVACTVVLSTVFALGYIPACIAIFLH